MNFFKIDKRCLKERTQKTLALIVLHSSATKRTKQTMFHTFTSLSLGRRSLAKTEGFRSVVANSMKTCIEKWMDLKCLRLWGKARRTKCLSVRFTSEFSSSLSLALHSSKFYRQVSRAAWLSDSKFGKYTSLKLSEGEMKTGQIFAVVLIHSLRIEADIPTE